MGRDIIDLQLKQPTLEDVFLKLTGHALTRIILCLHSGRLTVASIKMFVRNRQALYFTLFSHFDYGHLSALSVLIKNQPLMSVLPFKAV
jgi:hypothetical protein